MKQFDRHLIVGCFALFGMIGFGHTLTSGPAMPEYTTFEPVDATDMVNLSSGDFSWSLPVMTVPGPGLGFPIVLSNHAGVGVKDEASWVGLGWSLQAGSINRQVNKIPDDFFGDKITEIVKSNTISGFMVSVALNGATIGISYDAINGVGGMVGYQLKISENVGIGAQAGINGAYGGLTVSLGIGDKVAGSLGVEAELSVNSSGGGLSLNASKNGGRASIGASFSQQHGFESYSASGSLKGMGASLSSRGSFSNLGISGSGFRSSVGQMQSSSKGGSMYFPTPWGIGTLSWTSWNTWIEGFDTDHFYGFLYADKVSMDCANEAVGSINCHGLIGDAFQKKHEFLEATEPYVSGSMARLMTTSQDVYIVNAQGIDGAFKPFRKEDGDYLNALEKVEGFHWDWNSWGDIERDRTKNLEIYSNLLNKEPRVSIWQDDPAQPAKWRGDGDLYWRFLDDPAGAEYLDPNERDKSSTALSHQSRRVVPLFDTKSKLKGFRLTNASGVTYAFEFPLYNLWEKHLGKDAVNSDFTATTSQDWEGYYAYSWLLTSIKSPDYVDVDGDGTVTSRDIGGWVKFTYGDGTTPDKKHPYYWRTPYYDPTDPSIKPEQVDQNPIQYGPNAIGQVQSKGTKLHTGRQAAVGLKEVAFLQKIETPSHYAEFVTSWREDGIPFKGSRAFVVPQDKLESNFSIVSGCASGDDECTDYTAIINNKVSPLELFPGFPSTQLNTNDLFGFEVHYRFDYRAEVPREGGGSDWIEDHFEGIETGFGGVGPFQSVSVQNRLLKYEPTLTLTVKIFPILGTISHLQRLDKILLFNKSSSSEIRSVKFNYDYSLCTGTPNSNAPNGGKLSLRGLTLGAGSNGPWMNPYSFSYADNFNYQATSNTLHYELGRWDRWGNLCQTCVDGYHESNGEAAGAWSLNRITYPSGGEIKVEYETDKYQFVGKDPVLEPIGDNQARILVHRNGLFTGYNEEGHGGEEFFYEGFDLTNMKRRISELGLTLRGFRISFKTPNTRFGRFLVGPTKNSVTDSYSEIPWFNKTATQASLPNCSHACTQVCSPARDGFTCDGSWISEYYGEAGIPINATTIHVSMAGLSDELQLDVDFTLYAIVDNPSSINSFPGGGHRVKKMEFFEPISGKTKTVAYTYLEGTTPSLPSSFSNYDDSRHPVNRGYEFFVGGPGVMYGKVDVVMNGDIRTSYNFLTSRNLPVQVGVPSSAISETGGSKRYTVTVSDPSMLWGSLWKMEQFTNGNGLVQTTTNSWVMNESQMPSGVWSSLQSDPTTQAALMEFPRKSGTNTPYVRMPQEFSGKDGYFGLVQTLASHRYFHLPCTAIENGCPQTDVATTQVVHQKYVPYPYRNWQRKDGLATENLTYFPDFLTGGNLKSRTQGAYGEYFVTEIVPAHEKYPTLKTTNQLDQAYAKNTYRYYFPDRDFMQDEEPNSAVSSTLTLWRPYTAAGITAAVLDSSSLQAFRVFRTMDWKLGVGPNSGRLLVPDDGCIVRDKTPGPGREIACNQTGNALPSTSWRVTDEILSYDSFGHALESRASGGAVQTTLFEYGASLPTFLAQNARKNEVLFESFESWIDYRCKMAGWGDDLSCKHSSVLAPFPNHLTRTFPAKTGKKVLEVYYGPVSNNVCFDLPNPTVGKTYESSAWFYDDVAAGSGVTATSPGMCVGVISGKTCQSLVSKSFAGLATGSKTWKRMGFEVSIPSGWSGNMAGLGVCLTAGGGGATAAVQYDELRFRPKQSLMTTFTYDRNGKVSSSADVNETATHFEYDFLGNLRSIKDEDGRILTEQAKRMEYFAGEG